MNSLTIEQKEKLTQYLTSTVEPTSVEEFSEQIILNSHVIDDDSGTFMEKFIRAIYAVGLILQERNAFGKIVVVNQDNVDSTIYRPYMMHSLQPADELMFEKTKWAEELSFSSIEQMKKTLMSVDIRNGIIFRSIMIYEELEYSNDARIFIDWSLGYTHNYLSHEHIKAMINTLPITKMQNRDIKEISSYELWSVIDYGDNQYIPFSLLDTSKSFTEIYRKFQNTKEPCFIIMDPNGWNYDSNCMCGKHHNKEKHVFESPDGG